MKIMCHIFLKDEGSKSLPTDKEVYEQWQGNNDGAGFALSHKDWDEVQWMKGLDYNQTIRILNGIRSLDNLEDYVVALHLRLGTHGASVPALTHPFPINEEDRVLELSGNSKIGVMMHNGIISNFLKEQGIPPTNYEKVESDTTQFVVDYLPFVSDITVLQGKIGYNKLVFILPYGVCKVVNAQLGEVKNGIWNSNPVTSYSHWTKADYEETYDFRDEEYARYMQEELLVDEEEEKKRVWERLFNEDEEDEEGLVLNQ